MYSNFINILLITLSTTLLNKGVQCQTCVFTPSANILKCDQIADLSLIDTSVASVDSIKTLSIRYNFMYRKFSLKRAMSFYFLAQR